VPHTEKVEEEYVAINKDYHKSMFSARRHINRREAIVGWYTTTTDAGEVIINNTSLIHDFYAKECASPVHLVVDTTLIGDTMGIRAFLSVPLIAGPYTFANMFHEVKVELEISSHELVCLHQMIKGQGHVSQPWVGSTVVAAIPSEARALTESSSRLLEVIDSILEYVNGVVDGSQTAHEDIGMALADTLGATQGVRTEDFQSVFQTKTQDILMVSYLTTLIQNQLAIAEKLNQII
jgi:translation initiation factor 3 subunit F